VLAPKRHPHLGHPHDGDDKGFQTLSSLFLHAGIAHRPAPNTDYGGGASPASSFLEDCMNFKINATDHDA
jgi:hypothetical protein